jgi:hypothetical protein
MLPFLYSEARQLDNNCKANYPLNLRISQRFSALQIPFFMSSDIPALMSKTTSIIGTFHNLCTLCVRSSQPTQQNLCALRVLLGKISPQPPLSQDLPTQRCCLPVECSAAFNQEPAASRYPSAGLSPGGRNGCRFRQTPTFYRTGWRARCAPTPPARS